MPKRPPPGPCTYCHEVRGDLTWDHALPLSWYPDITPPDLEKWKVPACTRCNATLGQAESELLIRLGLCLGPQEFLALGISDKAIRALKPEYAKSEKDRLARDMKRSAILGEVVTTKTLPETGVFPNFGPRPGITYDDYHIITIPEDLVTSYARKLVRGLSLIIDGVLLPRDYSIMLYMVDDDDLAPLIDLFQKRGRIYHRGLGFIVNRLSRDDDQAWIYAVQIWGRFRFYAVAQPPGERAAE